MKNIFALVVFVLAGCASTPVTHTLKSAPQACEEFCHDYALGLVDLGSAERAGPVFDIAEKHFQDPTRPDIPKKDWERAAMRVELALGRAATARATGDDIQKPLIAAVNAFSELLEMRAPKVWNWIALDFLRTADILRFDREWDVLKVDPGARFVLRQFLLVQRGAAPDLLLIKERADRVKGLNQLVALAHILSKAGDVRTIIAQEVNARLFEELKTADVASQQVVLEMQLTSNFVYWATPTYRESVRWIIETATELGVRGYFMPVTAFADVSERCDAVKPYYYTLLGVARNELGTLDLVMGCAIRWGGYYEIVSRMRQIDATDTRVADWRTLTRGDIGSDGLKGGNTENWVALLKGASVESFAAQGAFPWSELHGLRHASSIAEHDAAWRRVSVLSAWFAQYGIYRLSVADKDERARILGGPGDDSYNAVLNGKSFDDKSRCYLAHHVALIAARIGGTSAAFSLLNLPSRCGRTEGRLREAFVAPAHRLELANVGVSRCSAEALKGDEPNSNSVIWCDVVFHRVRERAPHLEKVEDRYSRDTAVHVLIALKKYEDARSLFETYGITSHHDYMTDQLLRVHEGKAIDIPGIRFSSIWGETFPHQEIVPTLWTVGRHKEACEVLTALTSVRPWVAHPGHVNCPETNAAYKERWGFDPPWTLPQDEILAFLRGASETN